VPPTRRLKPELTKASMALTHSASSTSIDDGGEISRRKRANANSKNRQKTNGLGEAGASDETNQNEPEKKREDTPPAPL
jgi:hypothetical protein